MIVHFSPQRGDHSLAYSIDGQAETITATLDGKSDLFDLSGLPDGVMESCETALDVCPIVSARRVDGVLEVTLLRFHGKDAPVAERFPKPLEVTGAWAS